jgi:hypothetical protein
MSGTPFSAASGTGNSTASAGSGRLRLSVDKPDSAALQIMSMVDGLSVQSAIRGTFDYTDVRTLVTAATEQILGLRLRT